MSIVVEVIAEYLQNNRRLVVPAFGAFVVKETGERLFSDLLTTDDGVLVSLLRARGLSEMEAAVSLDRFIFEVRHELEQYGYCRLGEIGTLRVEPATKALKLYPPVQGELPKQKPYIPHPLKDEGQEINLGERGEKRNESEVVVEAHKTTTPNAPNASKTSKTPNLPKTPRKKFDLVMVVAVVILVAALVAIGYGWYVSNLTMADDDAAMDALRITPEQIVNE